MDVVQYTGVERDDHRALKMWCAATDCTLASVREEAMVRQMEKSPGMDIMKQVCAQVRDAVEQARAAAEVEGNTPLKVNGKNKK